MLAAGFLACLGLCYCCLLGRTADVRHCMAVAGLAVGSPLPRREVVNNLAETVNRRAGLSSCGLPGKRSG